MALIQESITVIKLLSSWLFSTVVFWSFTSFRTWGCLPSKDAHSQRQHTGQTWIKVVSWKLEIFCRMNDTGKSIAIQTIGWSSKLSPENSVLAFPQTPHTNIVVPNLPGLTAGLSSNTIKYKYLQTFVIQNSPSLTAVLGLPGIESPFSPRDLQTSEKVVVAKTLPSQY